MSKCDAGVEIPPHADCPKCGAGPRGPCWVGLQRDEAELKRLRKALEKIACPHVTESPLWWQKEARAALAPSESNTP